MNARCTQARSRGEPGRTEAVHSLKLRSRSESLSLERIAQGIEDATWSSTGYLSFSRTRRDMYPTLLRAFPEYQLCLVDSETDYPYAVASCAPVSYSLGNLPDEGWEWLVEQSLSDKSSQANGLALFSVSVPTPHQRLGFGRMMIDVIRAFAQDRRFDYVISPARPRMKSQHPRISIGEYLGWRNPRGEIYDSCLRTHSAAGGTIVRPCRRSMVVEEPVAFWEAWAGRHFEESGDYVLDGALSTLRVDAETQTGRYEEPHVWILHSL